MTKKMTKKSTSMVRLFASVALGIVLCFSMALPALAAEELPKITWEFGSEEIPAEAAITKLLRTGEGTSTPEANFDFLFTPKSIDNKTGAEDLAAMPIIGKDGIVNVTYTGNEKSTTNNGTKIVPKESESLFKTIEWQRAGVYVYTVTEIEDTYEKAPSFNEQMTYSKAKYDIYVYVVDGKDSPYVYAVGAVVVVKDGENGAEVGDKVDPTPKDPEVSGNYSKMTFTNDYLKRTTEENKPNSSALAISKNVTQLLADRSKYFGFDVTVTNPVILTETTTKYKAYVLDDKGAVVTSKENFEPLKSDAHGSYIEFTTGQALTVNLKHGQQLNFVDTYVGGSFKATEAAVADYTPSCKLTLDGVVSDLQGEAGKALTVPSSGIAYLGENTNSAAFTNAYQSVTPTGIAVNDLPYIMLIVVALAALAGYFVTRTRRYAADNA